MKGTMTQGPYQAAIAAFDQANSADPNRETWAGQDYPKELLYAQRIVPLPIPERDNQSLAVAADGALWLLDRRQRVYPPGSLER